MGDAARRAYLRRTTPEERFDDGLRLCEAMIHAVLAKEGLAELRTPEEARRAFLILRHLSEA